MPRAEINGIELSYVESGAGEETVVFSHSYLVDHRQFGAQITALEPDFRVIAYDHRDHGASAASTSAYTFEDLVRDAVGIIEHTRAAPCHWVGHSTGGFIGTRLMFRQPQLLRSVTLMDASAEGEALMSRLKYRAMLAVLAIVGPRPLMGAVRRTMFGRSSLRDPARAATIRQWSDHIASRRPQSTIRFGRAIFERDDVLDQLREVDVPTLVMIGEEDVGVPPAHARRIADAVPNARLEILPGVGHLCTIEDPEAVSAVLVPFLRALRGR